MSSAARGLAPQLPLSVLVVRTYRLPQALGAPYLERFAGCRSWVELEEALERAVILTDEETIRAADQSGDTLVRSTRPLQSWVSLVAAIVYVFTLESPDIFVLSALLTLPFTYAGLRGVDKVVAMVGQVKRGRK